MYCFFGLFLVLYVKNKTSLNGCCEFGSQSEMSQCERSKSKKFPDPQVELSLAQAFGTQWLKSLSFLFV